MVLAQSRWVGADDDLVLDPIDARLAESAFWATSTSDSRNVRTGLVWAGAAQLLTGQATTDPPTVQVAAHHFVAAKDVLTEGVYVGTNATPTLVAVPAAPALGNKRIDLIWVRQKDKNSLVSPDAVTAAEYGLITGTPGSAPSKPALSGAPSGAVEVGTVTWDSTATVATTTNAAQCTLTTTGQWTVSRGAPVPVRNATERAALGVFAGARVLRLDAGGRVDTYDGSMWDSTDAWANLPIVPGGWTEPSGVRWQARLLRDVVHFRGTLANATFTGGYTTVCTLPAGIPAPTVRTPLNLTANTAASRSVMVETDGTVQLYAEAASAAWYVIGGSYPRS